VICLPFFAAAPTAMWHQVVRDQLTRDARAVPTLDRLDRIVGLDIFSRSYPPAITVAAVVVLVGCAALAWSYREARLPVLLMLGQGLYLLIIPMWFPHFAGFTAAPVALTAGAAMGRLIALVRARPAEIAVGVVATAALFVYATGWAGVTYNRRLPDQFRALAIAGPGCITADDPTALVATDTLSRNLSRGCPLIADFGGHSHDMAAAAGAHVPRNDNQAFQRFALDHLRSGSVTILIRYSGGRGFNKQTTAVLEQWPLLARSGRYQVRQPVALDQSGGTR
jgi:alpha-1,2-mannosyltransferase